MCAWRLSDGVVHPAEHHHVGKTADSEQPFRDRNPVSWRHIKNGAVASIKSDAEMLNAFSDIVSEAEVHAKLISWVCVGVCPQEAEEADSLHSVKAGAASRRGAAEEAAEIRNGPLPGTLRWTDA